MKKILLITVFFVLTVPGNSMADTKTVIDAAGRIVEVPSRVSRVICSGPGCLRLLTYLQSQHMAVAVDSIDKKETAFDARPYALANPGFKQLPLFGEFRGHDNPELIMTLEPQPQVIFKTFRTMGHDPVELQNKTGIPVVILEYGDLGDYRETLYQSIRIMGSVISKEKRAEDLISFFDEQIHDLQERTSNIPETEKKSCFVGGIAKKGPHGFQSTEPGYPPFLFVNAKNLAYDKSFTGGALQHSNIAKEKIVEWDPEILFLDLSTLEMGDKAGGLHELKTDPAYLSLTAVERGEVYGLLPYNWYSMNYGSILADACFIGKVLYPDRFRDVDIRKKADEIYTFLVGEPVFNQMDKAFQELAYDRIPLKQMR